MTPAECLVCMDSGPEELVRLGCACIDVVAHVSCMVRLARVNTASWRECRTCKRKLSGRMLHMLCGHPTVTGEAVCRIHELLRLAYANDVPVARPPVNDQTCFRVPLPAHGAHSAISIAARREGSGYEAVLLDQTGQIVKGSARSFDMAEARELLRHGGCMPSVLAPLFRVAFTARPL